MLRKKVGDKIEKGEPLVTLYANCENVDEVIAKIYANIRIEAEADSYSDYGVRENNINSVNTTQLFCFINKHKG